MSIFKQFIQNNFPFILTALVIFLLFLSGWIIMLSLKLKNLLKKSEAFFAGGKVGNLEEMLLEQTKNIKLLDKDIQELYNISNQINKLAFLGLHRVGIVRFNPFKDVGGNQSFAIALLNGKNNGVTISSLYTREGTRIYSKAITAGKSEKYPLTEEEKEVIKQAMENKDIQK